MNDTANQPLITVWSWRAAIEKSHLTSTVKLVLFVLANYMNEHGDGAFPSIARLAGGASLSRRAVITAVQQAEKAGYLIRKRRQSSDRGNEPSLYRAAFPGNYRTPTPSERGAPPSAPVAPGSESDAPPLVNDVHQVVQEVHHPSERDDTTLVHQVHPNSPIELSSELSRKEEEDIARRMFATWQEIVQPKAIITDARRKTLRRRAADTFSAFEDWLAYCRQIAASPFLMGENERKWRIDLDFALNPSNIAKVLEGKYDPKGSGGGKPASPHRLSV